MNASLILFTFCVPNPGQEDNSESDAFTRFLNDLKFDKSVITSVLFTDFI